MKAKCDQWTDRPTDRRTERVVESRARDKKCLTDGKTDRRVMAR